MNLQYVIIIAAFIFSVENSSAQNKLSGIITDHNSKKPISNCMVYFPDIHTSAVTNENGEFTLREPVSKNIIGQVSKTGYKSKMIVLNLDSIIRIDLEPNHIRMQEVVVSIPKGKLQTENIVMIERRDLKELKSNAPASLAEALTNIAGVEQRSTGVGIGKPIIRGLSGNRIVTYAQEIRQENQQWGDEHGLGLGDVGIESVEIIKGPASLLYGSDALGGVVYFVEERYAKENSIESYIQSGYQSNNLNLSNTGAFKINSQGVKLNLFANHQTTSDYQMPDERRVNNTRFNEWNFKTALGFSGKNRITNIRYSYIQNNFGITEDSSTSEDISRKIELPYQKIDNHNLSLSNIFYAKNSDIHLILGYSVNHRGEYADKYDTPDLSLRLQTFSYNLKWNIPIWKNSVQIVFGSQGMHQINENEGTEALIPDSKVSDIGGFVMATTRIKEIQFQGGLRLDYRGIHCEEFIQDTMLKFSELNRSFVNPNFSIGASYTNKKFTLRTNISNGFRSPNTSELSSNGVHEGTNRYELGNYNMETENALQFDFSFDYTNEHFQFAISPYINRISNYIYLAPTNSIIDNSPVYKFQQKNAVLYGGEMGIHYHPHVLHWLHVESTVSSVYAQDDDGNPLPLIPAAKWNSTLKAEINHGIKDIFINHIYKFRQDRVDVFESETPNYQLLNAGINFEIKAHDNPIEMNFVIRNIFNQKYIDHLSRFKSLGLDNQGINFAFGVKFLLSKKIK